MGFICHHESVLFLFNVLLSDTLFDLKMLQVPEPKLNI